MVRTVRGPYLITTSPSMTVCSSCHATVVAVTVAGFDRHIDLAALNDAGELVALLSGCQTYELVGDELMKRNAAMIAKPRTRPVLADHRCAAGRPLAIPVEQTDPETMAKAVVQVVAALGGQVVTGRDRSEPPF